MGCSSTYTLRDFSSRQNFYNDFNKSIKNRELNIKLHNNNTVVGYDGVLLSNDTLVIVTESHEVHKNIKSSEIKNIQFYGVDFSKPSAKIFLKDGEEYDGMDVRINYDSTVEFSVVVKINSYLPLIKIKEVTYKKNVLGIPFGFLVGVVGGALVGRVGLIPVYESDRNAGLLGTKNNKSIDYVSAVIYGSGIGMLVGSVVGLTIGYNYTYQFNP